MRQHVECEEMPGDGRRYASSCHLPDHVSARYLQAVAICRAAHIDMRKVVDLHRTGHDVLAILSDKRRRRYA